MLLDPSLVVVVTVTKTSAAIDRQGFGTPMGVFQVVIGTQANRFATYTTVQEMLDAGFAATDNAVQWATIVKAQNPAPQRFGIGRRTPGTAQVDTVTITTTGIGTWTVTIDAIVFSFVAVAASTEQQIAVGLANNINASNPSPVSVNASVPVAGVFTVTANVAGEAFVNGGIVVPGAGVGTFVNTVPNAAAEVMATTLAAILAENSVDWYGFSIETRNDVDITAADVFVTPLDKQFFGQSLDADALAGTPANIFDTIQALNNPRTTLFWHDDEREYLDGGALAIMSAANLDAAGGSITMFGKQVTGVPADNLSSAQVVNIAGDGESNDGFGGNVYVPIAGRSVILWGKSSEGEFNDVQWTIDWTFFRVSEEVFGALVTTPTKIPYTNAGIAVVANEVRGVLNTGVTNGHFTNDDPAFPNVSVPLSSEVSTTDKNTRVLRNVVGNAKLAGAIHKTFIQINVAA